MRDKNGKAYSVKELEKKVPTNRLGGGMISDDMIISVSASKITGGGSGGGPSILENTLTINKQDGTVIQFDGAEPEEITLTKVDKTLDSTSENAISNKAVKGAIDSIVVPTKVSELNNDLNYQTAENVDEIISGKGFISSVPDEYITEDELNSKGYQTLSDVNGLLESKADKSGSYPDLTVGTATKVSNALTFTGAAEGTYDGSSALTINIPQGGSSITVDDSLSTSSMNPVQNKVITAALNGKLDSDGKAASATTADTATSADTAGKVSNALTFTGAVSDTYDGSAAKTVNIPSPSTLSSLGITATEDELNYCDGVTSNIQDQLNGKLATNGKAISAATADTATTATKVSNALTFTGAVKDVYDGSSAKTINIPSETTLSSLGVTATSDELNFVAGVTSGIQTQLDGKLATTGKAASATKADTATSATTATTATKVSNALTFTGAVTGTYDGSTAKTVNIPAAATLSSLGVTATAAELNYCDGVTSNIQTQLNGKLPTNGKAASATKADTATSATSATTATKVSNALTFTGAVTGTYDGSAAKTVNIPLAGLSVSSVSGIDPLSQTKTGLYTFNTSDYSNFPSNISGDVEGSLLVLPGGTNNSNIYVLILAMYGMYMAWKSKNSETLMWMQIQMQPAQG